MHPLPASIANLAIAFVVAACDLADLELEPRVAVESSGLNGWHLSVWLTDQLRHRLWISATGRTVALSFDADGATLDALDRVR